MQEDGGGGKFSVGRVVAQRVIEVGANLPLLLLLLLLLSRQQEQEQEQDYVRANKLNHTQGSGRTAIYWPPPERRGP